MPKKPDLEEQEPTHPEMPRAWKLSYFREHDPCEEFWPYREKALKRYNTTLKKALKASKKVTPPLKERDIRDTLEMREAYALAGYFIVRRQLGRFVELQEHLKPGGCIAKEMKNGDQLPKIYEPEKHPFRLGYALLFPTLNKAETKRRTEICRSLAYAYEHNVPPKWAVSFVKGAGGIAKAAKKFTDGEREWHIKSKPELSLHDRDDRLDMLRPPSE